MPSLASLSSISFGRKKETRLTGLNIEAGGVAAVEVSSKVTTRSPHRQSSRWRPVCSTRARWSTPTAWSGRSRRSSPSTGFPNGFGSDSATSEWSSAPCGCRRSKTRRRWKRQSASRRRSRSRCRSTRRFSNIRSSAACPPTTRRRPQVDVVVIAARRDAITSFLGPLRRAGLEPVGIDLSAFGMIRALSPLSASAPSLGADGPHPPRRPSSTATSATSPTSRSLAVAPASSPGSRTSASARSPGASPPTTVSAREHAAQWLALRRPRAAAGADRGRSRRSSPALARTLEEGVVGCGRRAASLARLLRAQESRGAGERDRALRTGQRRSPGLAARMEEHVSGCRSLPPRPPALAGFDERHGGPPHPPLRPGAGAAEMRPVNLIPPEQRQGAARADAHRADRLHPRRRAGARCSPGSPSLVADRQRRSPNARPKWRSCEREDAAAERQAQRLAAYTQFQALHEQRVETSPASPTVASTGSG